MILFFFFLCVCRLGEEERRRGEGWDGLGWEEEDGMGRGGG